MSQRPRAARRTAVRAHASLESAPDVIAALASNATNAPLESARAFIALGAVALILFQGPKGDGVVNTLNERRVFGSASQAKSAVDYLTYGLIGSFIVLSGVLAASQ
jgi:preprotein translocase subunit SecG